MSSHDDEAPNERARATGQQRYGEMIFLPADHVSCTANGRPAGSARSRCEFDSDQLALRKCHWRAGLSNSLRRSTCAIYFFGRP